MRDCQKRRYYVDCEGFTQETVKKEERLWALPKFITDHSPVSQQYRNPSQYHGKRPKTMNNEIVLLCLIIGMHLIANSKDMRCLELRCSLYSFAFANIARLFVRHKTDHFWQCLHAPIFFKIVSLRSKKKRKDISSLSIQKVPSRSSQLQLQS